MDELKSAIAASAVQHKNLQPLLKSWQVGQLLIARVQDKTPSGNLLLQVSGQKVVAAADLTVQKGAVLMLEVTALNPSPSLKVVHNPVSQVMASNHPLENQLQLLIPRQGSVAAPLLALLESGQSANILSLLGVKNDEVLQLLKSAPALNTLSDPKVLQKAILESGLFLESELARIALRGGVLSHTDLKAVLLKLLFRIEQSISRARTQAGGQSLPNSLLELEAETKGALATITLNQLAAGSRDDRDGNTWLFDMPFRYADSLYGLTIAVARQSSGDDAPPEAHRDDWKVLLSLCLPRLGEIEADLFLSGSKVSVVVYAQAQQTADKLNEQLPGLKAGLERQGLNVSVLLCHHGQRGYEMAKTQWTLTVDIKA